MRTFIKIFNGKDGTQVAQKVNDLAKNEGLDIVNATSFMWQGVIYTTVVFSEKQKARSNAKKEVE